MMGRPNFAANLHGAQGLAVAFGLGHAEVPIELLLGIAAFLFADQQHGLAVEPAHAANDGRIVAEKAVAVDFLKVGQNALDVVERVRALGMARVLDALPGSFLPIRLRQCPPRVAISKQDTERALGTPGRVTPRLTTERRSSGAPARRG